MAAYTGFGSPPVLIVAHGHEIAAAKIVPDVAESAGGAGVDDFLDRFHGLRAAEEFGKGDGGFVEEQRFFRTDRRADGRERPVDYLFEIFGPAMLMMGENIEICLPVAGHLEGGMLFEGAPNNIRLAKPLVITRASGLRR